MQDFPAVILGKKEKEKKRTLSKVVCLLQGAWNACIELSKLLSPLTPFWQQFFCVRVGFFLCLSWLAFADFTACKVCTYCSEWPRFAYWHSRVTAICTNTIRIAWKPSLYTQLCKHQQGTMGNKTNKNCWGRDWLVKEKKAFSVVVPWIFAVNWNSRGLKNVNMNCLRNNVEYIWHCPIK